MSSERIRKLNDLLRDEVGKILLHELRLSEGVFVTVLGANISPTLEHAAVHISVIPESKEKDILKMLKHRIFDIQQMLNKHLNMRPVPKIRFEIDATEKRASHIEEILQKDKERW